MELSNLLYEDVSWCLLRLPKSLFNMMKEEKGNAVLSGGYIRSCIGGEKVSDIDMFSTSKSTAELLARRYADKNGRMIETCNAYTIVDKGKTAVQFIHRWTFDKPEDIIPSFDFTIARAAIWFDGEVWRGVCDPRFYQDLAAKRLVYCSPKRIEEAGGSLLRVLKFYQRGYRIPLNSLAATMARLCSAVHFDVVIGAGNDPASFEDRLSFVLAGLLKEVDPQLDPMDRAYFPMPTDEDAKE